MKKLVIFDFLGTIDSDKKFEKDIIDNIKNLSDKYIFTIVSSSSSSYIKNYLEKRDVFVSFSDILGSNFNLTKKDRINALLKKYNIKTEDAVYITDTVGDISEADECGVKSIAVTWGFHDKETLEKGNPVAIIDDPRDLENTINNVLK